jgi:maltooligosyltrehalose trehalohydrolase
VTELRAWAPRPSRLELAAGGGRIPARAVERGWWAAGADVPDQGADYSWVVDGEPLPDPRSPWQPAGVHGPSRTVDHAAFAWSDAGWRCPPLRDLVMYELHVGTFSPEGTFDGVIDKLDHLAALGVNAIELMPVAEFAGDRGWGYDGVDLYAAHHTYGGPEGFKRLVDASHRRGIAVVLDVVYNHLGPEGNYLGRFGPYFTDRYSTPWGQAVNLDGADSDEVRDFFIENAITWCRDYHVDGLRLDAVHAIIDTSAVHLLEELRLRVPADRFVIAESDLNDPRLVESPERGGYGLDAQWADDFHHALHAVLTGEQSGYYADFGSLEQLAAALRGPYVYAGHYSRHRRRRHGRPHRLPGDRFVVCSQNHDQVGNRARGERLAALTTFGRLKMAAALVLCSPFIPLLFMGEEWAASTPFIFFSSHGDPQIARATTRGRVEEFESFGWDPAEVPDPQDPVTYERSKLRWDEVAQDSHAEMLDWYKKLIRLRRTVPELRDGRLDTVDVRVSGRKFELRRGPVIVRCDLDGDAVTIES